MTGFRVRMSLAALALLLAAPAWAGTESVPLRDIADLLSAHGCADVRSLEAEGDHLKIRARRADGRVIDAVADLRDRSVAEKTADLGPFVRYAAPAPSQMGFGELMALVESKWPASTLSEVKLHGGAYEVHLRTAAGSPVGILVDVTTRVVRTYHSID